MNLQIKMNNNVCDSCENNIQKQSTRFIGDYIKALSTILSRKELCEDLVDIIMSFIINGNGHCIEYQTKDRWENYSHSYYKVCSPCFQNGLYKYLNTHHTKIELPHCRYQKFFARDKLEYLDAFTNKYKKIARTFLLRFFLARDYNVYYYRKKKPSILFHGGKMFYLIDYQ